MLVHFLTSFFFQLYSVQLLILLFASPWQILLIFAPRAVVRHLATTVLFSLKYLASDLCFFYAQKKEPVQVVLHAGSQGIFIM